MNEKIFGYDWADIQCAQQGGRLGKPVSLGKPSECDDSDVALLDKYGLARLEEMRYFGVIDRLRRAGHI